MTLVPPVTAPMPFHADGDTRDPDAGFSGRTNFYVGLVVLSVLAMCTCTVLRLAFW